MKIVQLLTCTAAACFFSTGIFADELSAALAQAQTDFVNAKQECRKKGTSEARTKCVNKAAADNKANVQKIKADDLKKRNAAVETRRKAIAEATAVQLKAKQDANADYDKAVKKAEADYDAKVKP